jgi:hypothetical protein
MVLGTGFATRALADSTQTTYTATGTYANGTMPTPLTSAGDSFTIQFTVPTIPGGLVADPWPGDDIYLYPMNVDYATNGVDTLMTNTLVAFYRSTAESQSGGFFVDWCATDITCATGLEYQWTFGGPQQYDGNELDPTMTPSDFTFTNQSFIIYNNTFEEHDSSINGVVTQQTTSVPEPSNVVLLLAGLAAAGLLLKMRG